ncbi:Dyp-type peroxidase [Neisseria gonorrhoeae]|uniref:Possible periplasmic protein n=1 Tax=Neisseria gonorrhoeae (strain NCCP11945) TaxID=521006 RepID=B4RPL1_NEIG2|nr:Dyp-type peroxidase [Neisseria gonorrhoeae]ACF30784.1 Possible periplasmic protein [Neisseria gonorrhoeae NCCP11945]APW54155.1 Tat-translocated enzyme [Neisseria gonorrhoeae NG-k51.05]KDN02515.1 peroxidase [Neisseria gonorrhoeae]KLS13070.1 Tat-translocated enzyme [Neisseria gonorrhoeae SK32402]KLS47573.1 Tat-translocated enzyme [Neisseria gonorrhoeae ALB_2011_01-02]
MSQNQPAQPTKRNLFKTALAVGAIGAIGGYFGGKKQGETAERTAESQHSPQAYPCYGEHQAGIVTPRQAFSIMCAFDVTAQSAKQLENLFRTLTARIEFLTQGGEYQDGDDKLPSAGSGILGKAFNPDGLTVTVGVGSSLFDGRFGLKDKKTVHLQEMRDFPNDKLQKSWCDGDLSLQICAFTPETCQAALRDIIKHTAQTAVIRWSIDGWQPKSEPGAMAARNLLGFRDGTGNPKVSDPKTADEVLWTGVAANSLDEPEWAKNGSYQANLADGFIFVQNLLNGEPLEECISPFGGGYFFVLPGVGKGGFLGQGLPGV